jgi:hypothetical protein
MPAEHMDSGGIDIWGLISGIPRGQLLVFFMSGRP